MSEAGIPAGSSFSILGDSISTLKGYLPNYCKSFYLQNPLSVCSGISRPMDTWWARVISHFRGTLCVNNSYSGCLVSGMEFPCATHLLRYGELHCNPGSYYFTFQDEALHHSLCTTKVIPDVILVFLGTNDWIFGAPIHSETENRMFFSTAYPYLLRKLRQTYPESRIICATLFQNNNAATDALYPIADYNTVIRQSAEEQGCLLAELAASHDEIETIDGIHPSYQGMYTLAELWIQSMNRFDYTNPFNCGSQKSATVQPTKSV